MIYAVVGFKLVLCLVKTLTMAFKEIITICVQSSAHMVRVAIAPRPILRAWWCFHQQQL